MNRKQWQIVGALGVGMGVAFIASLHSRVSIPKRAKAVRPFNKDRYLGKWYEIARKDFRYERGLSNVTAQYVENADGSIKVINRGYNDADRHWEESRGKAKSAGKPGEARWKVSFFGPFYAGYNVIELDANYQYAMVAGNNLNYLWILSRTKNIPDKVKQAFLEKAADIGYRVDDLTWTTHDKA